MKCVSRTPSSPSRPARPSRNARVEPSSDAVPVRATTLAMRGDLGVGVICGRGETVPGVQLDRYGMPGIPEVGHIFI